MKSISRDAIAVAIRPDLDEDEEILDVVTGRVGARPSLWLATPWKRFSGMRGRTISLTSHGLVVHAAPSIRPSRPTTLLRRLAFSQPIGPLTGSWTAVELGNERIWIHRRYRDEVDSMNAQIGLFDTVSLYEKTMVRSPIMNTRPSA